MGGSTVQLSASNAQTTCIVMEVYALPTLYLASFPGPCAAFGCTKEQATKSWAGPGNETTLYLCFEYLSADFINITFHIVQTIQPFHYLSEVEQQSEI